MARERRQRSSDTLPEPDTLPLMNIIFMLILALLTMASILPLGFLSSEAQRLSSGAATLEKKEEKKPLNLIIFITENGFNFSVQGVAKMGEPDPRDPKRKLPIIPKITLADGNTEYDFAALQERLMEYKKLDKDEQSITITADPKVIFNVIVQTMDAARFDTEKHILFPKVAFAAGLVG